MTSRPITFPMSAPGAQKTTADFKKLATQMGFTEQAAESMAQGVADNSKQFKDFDDAADQVLGKFSTLQKEVSSGRFFADETAARVDTALGALVEFGASQEQVGEAFRLTGAAATKYNKTQSEIAKTLEKLVDESEMVDASMRELGLAVQLADTKMLKLEDSGKLVGRVLRGDVAALRELSPAAKAAADAIEKIPDASERARLGMNVLRREAGGGVAALDSIRGTFGQMDAGLARLGITGVSSAAMLGTVATAAGAAVVGLAKLTFDGMLQFEKTTAEGQKRLELFNRELEKLENTAGGAAHEMVGFDEVVNTNTARLSGLSKVLKDLEGDYEDNKYQVDNLTQGFGYLGATLLWLASPFKWVAAAAAGAKWGFDELVGTEDELADIQARVTREIWENNRAILAIEGPMRTWQQRVDGMKKAWTDFKNTLADGVRTEGYYDPKTGDPLSSDIPIELAPKKPTGGGRKRNVRQEILDEMAAGLAEFERLEARPADFAESIRAMVDKGELWSKLTEEKLRRTRQTSREVSLLLADLYRQSLKRAGGGVILSEQFQRDIDGLSAASKRFIAAETAWKARFGDLPDTLSADVRTTVDEFNRLAAITEANTQLFVELDGVAQTTFSNMTMALGESLAIMATQTGSMGELFTGVFLDAMGALVPVLAAWGNALIAAESLWGVGVLVAAGVLAGLIGAAKSKLAGRGRGGAPSAARGSQATTIQNRARNDREQMMNLTFNLHYAADFVEQQQITAIQRAMQLFIIRQGGRQPRRA